MSIVAEREVTVQTNDPYVLSPENVMDPPKTIKGSFKFLGPGILLSAGIVGSGELIATTTLGAQAGFVTLWVILVSCLVKVCVQLEWGKEVIYSGKPSMQVINNLPGPKLKGANWSIWFWLVLMITKFLQLGGIVGGVALALNIAFPNVDVSIWAWVAAIATALIVFRGAYQLLEKAAVIMIGSFTIMTFVALFALQATPYAITWANIAEGLTFQLPAGAIAAAIAAFGITGVGGDEIMQYGYWCLEKGYARYVGPKDGSPEWTERAKGWIKVMYVDATVSMIVYTVMTAAFYMLGSAVLHGMKQVPAGYDMMKVLANMYTETLGPGVMWMYVIGGIVVLFSTLFQATAAWTRQFSDAFAQMGVMDFYNTKQRARWIAVLAWFMPLAWTVLFLTFKAPVFMVTLGGIGTSVMLLICVYAAIYFKRNRNDAKMLPSMSYNIFFWISAISIGLLAIRGLLTALNIIK